MPYRKATQRDWLKLGAYLLLAAALTVISGVVLVPVAWPAGFLVWLALFVGGSLYLLVRWHAKAAAYRCPSCGHEFKISVLTDFASPQIPDRKCLRCPQCGERNWTPVLMVQD